MIRTRKNEFLGFGKKKAKTDEVSAKDLKPLLAREVVFGKKAYKLDALYMKDNTLTVHFETEIYANKKPVKIEAIFTIDFNGNLDDNNLIIYKEQSVYPKGAIHRNYELKPKKEIHNKHYNNLTDAADDCNDVIESNVETLLKNIVKDGYKLNVGESLRHDRPIREAEDEDGVIVKIGNKWRIRGKKVKYWDAEYDTKADAQAALRAYWANKGESFRRSLRKIRNAKLEKKNVKEMAGNIDTKSRDGVSLYLPYTSRDVELIIGGGDLGSFHVDANIDGKESLRKAVDKVIKKAAHNLNPDERDAIESALEKHLSRMRESKATPKKQMKVEATSLLRDGDWMLTYTGSVIDFDEMKEDVLSLLGLKDTSKLVLRVADESISSDEDEEMILATGDEALEKFYDTCLMVFEQGNPDVAVYLSRFDEITNFYEKLCLK